MNYVKLWSLIVFFIAAMVLRSFLAKDFASAQALFWWVDSALFFFLYVFALLLRANP